MHFKSCSSVLRRNIGVAFFNTTTNIFIVFVDKKFRNTDFYSNSIVKSRINSEIWVLAVTMTFFALAECREGGKSVAVAARDNDVPMTTLRSRLQGKIFNQVDNMRIRRA